MKSSLKSLKESLGLGQLASVIGPLVSKGIICREKDKKEKLADEEKFWINLEF
jgi:hypothetical protein